MEKRILEVSWATLWKVGLFVLFASIMFFGRKILLGLFLAIVISSGLEFIVTFLERRGIPRTIGVILIFLLGIASGLVLVYLVIPIIVADINTVFSSFSGSDASYGVGSLFTLETSQAVTQFITKFSTQFFENSTSPLGAFSGLVGSVGLAVAILVSSFYLSLSHDGVERFLKTVLPSDYEEYALRVYARARKVIGAWFRTQILLSITMGLLVGVSLTILNVRHAFLVAILAGLFELVPFVGPILSGAVATLFALTTSASLALYTLLVFLVLHQLESHVLVPLLTRRSVGLHPVIVIISFLMGFEVGGFLGGLVAVPLAAVLYVVIDERAPRKAIV